VVNEFIWQANFGQRCVNLCISKVLANSCANATYLDAVLDGDHEPVLSGHFHN
jgi:exonuclease III